MSRRPQPGGVRSRSVAGTLLLLALAVGLGALAAETGSSGTVVVGSKNFEESRLLGEIFAQLLEARTDLRVERRLGLAGTAVCFEALRTGALDLYPEYTGTALVTLLGETVDDVESRDVDADPTAQVLNRVRREFLHRWDLQWMAPLGFENAYELAVRQVLADEHQLHTISDLAGVAPGLKAGLGYEFVDRPDGLPGLEAAYGLSFARVQTLQQALKYQAAGAGEIDVLDVYTTDGRLVTYDLRVLEDDRSFFPPYQAAALVRGETLRRHPEIASALSLLAGSLDEGTMRSLNLRLQEGKEAEAKVARDALVDLGLLDSDDEGLRGQGETVESSDAGFLRYLWAERATLLRRTGEHLALSGAALALGVLIAVPLGLLLERRRRFAEPVIRAVGLTQTIPSLALLAFMVPLAGIGVVPALLALWVYSLFPILRNTYTGVRDAGPDAVESGEALGMTPAQILRSIRLPLAAPVILAGVRTAAVITVGTATLAAFIGAGGLGEPIVSGLQLADSRRILSGAIPAALLALAVDLCLGLLERRLSPAGLRAGG